MSINTTINQTNLSNYQTTSYLSRHDGSSIRSGVNSKCLRLHSVIAERSKNTWIVPTSNKVLSPTKEEINSKKKKRRKKMFLRQNFERRIYVKFWKKDSTWIKLKLYPLHCLPWIFRRFCLTHTSRFCLHSYFKISEIWKVLRVWKETGGCRCGGPKRGTRKTLCDSWIT